VPLQQQDSLLLAVAWPLLVLAVFVRLSVRRYRSDLEAVHDPSTWLV
jgi:hypothetical protein